MTTPNFFLYALTFNRFAPLYGIVSLWLMSLASVANAQTLVAVAPVGVGNLPHSLRLSGNIVSTEQVDIGNEIAGQVTDVLIEAGDQVQEGQILLQIRDTEARWQLAESRAELLRDEAEVALAQLAKQRIEKLIATNAATEENHDQARVRVAQAQAAVTARQALISRLEDRLNRHTVRAPFAGVITQRDTEKGGWLSEGDTIATLVSQRKLRLELAVPQHFYAVLNDQQENIQFDLNVSGHAVTGQFEQIIPRANASRNFTLRARVDNSQSLLIPGMAADAHITWPASNAGLYVPEDALVRRANGAVIVWKAVLQQDDEQDAEEDVYTAVAVPVTPSHSYKGNTRVESTQLDAGDQVVIRGNETLRPDQTLRIETVK